jgi:putative addiction module killer protein
MKVIKILRTEHFIGWFESLKDVKARARIDMRLYRIALGNLGDAKSVGGGVSEFRIDYGPGYRIYFTRRGKEIVVLLAGGDKKSQKNDIKIALAMAKII